MLWVLRIAGWALIVIGGSTPDTTATGQDMFDLGVVLVLISLAFGKQDKRIS